VLLLLAKGENEPLTMRCCRSLLRVIPTTSPLKSGSVAIGRETAQPATNRADRQAYGRAARRKTRARKQLKQLMQNTPVKIERYMALFVT